MESKRISEYVSELRGYLAGRLPDDQVDGIVSEAESHLHDSTEELIQNARPLAEATSTKRFGSAREFARKALQSRLEPKRTLIWPLLAATIWFGMWYLGPAIDLYFNASTHYEVTKWLTLGMLVCIPVLSFRYGKLLIHYFALCGLGVVLGASLLNCALFVEPDPIHGSLVSRREALNGDPAAEKDMPLLLAWQKDGAKLVHDLSLKSDDQREDNDHAYNVYIPVTYTDGSIDVDRGIKTMPIYNFRDAFEGSQRFLEAVNTTIRINKADIAAARIISTQGLFSQYGTFVSEGLHVLVMYWEIVAFLSLIGWVARCLTRRLVWPRRKYA